MFYQGVQAYYREFLHYIATPQDLFRVFEETCACQLDELFSEFLIAPTMLMGGDGAVVAVGNVAPRMFVDCYEACRAGNWEEGADIQKQLVDFSLGLFVMTPAGVPPSSFWGGLKQAMVALGVFDEPRLHRPLLPVSDELREKVDGTLRKYGML